MIKKMSKNLVESVERSQEIIVFQEKELNNQEYVIQVCTKCGSYIYESLNNNECPECHHTSEPINPTDLVHNVNELRFELQNLKAKNNEMATAGTLVTMVCGITLACILGLNIAFLGLVALMGSLGLIAWFNIKRY